MRRRRISPRQCRRKCRQKTNPEKEEGPDINIEVHNDNDEDGA